MKSKVIAHIDMDAFFASVEQRDNPSLRGRPVIVGADPKKGRGRGVVATCSYEARKYGIHSAMPISQAYRRCPQGVYISGNSRKYRAASDQIFDILHDFTPDVEPVSIDEAFMDISGSYHFYGTPLQTCAAIKERIQKEVRLTASIGIAPNKMVAKIASDFSKPNGLLQVTPGQVFEFLWPLPIEKLWGVGKQTQKVLNAMGMARVGDIANHPYEDLCARLGARGQHLYQLANGIDERDVYIDDSVKSVSHEHTFDQDVRDKEVILKIMSLLSEKVSRRLRKYGLKGRTLTVKIRLSDFKTVTRAFTFGERVNFFEEIFTKSWELFDTYYEPWMRIRLLGVRVSNFDEAYVQESLFQSKTSVKKEKVHAAVDRIKDKFGEKAIQRAQNI